MRIIKVKNYDQMSEEALKIILDVVRNKPNAVLGLATGSTPLGLYAKMIEDHKNNGTSYAECRAVNLDEYVGLDVNSDQSYVYFMRENLFKNIDIKLENTHIILLTDGDDFQKNEVIRCVKELSKKNTIHGVGLGRSCDMSLMKQCSQIGKGINVHAKDPNTLRTEVSKITQRILIPSLINCSIQWNIEGEMYPKIDISFGYISPSIFH